MSRRGHVPIILVAAYVLSAARAGHATPPQGQQCASTAACVAAIERAQRDTHTLTAEFLQTKYTSLLDEPLVSSGHLTLQRPDRVRLRVDKPQPATIVIKGGAVHIPNLPEQERRALSQTPLPAMFTELGALFTGSLHGVEEKFDISAVADATGITLQLQPRHDAWRQLFRMLTIRFEGPQLLIHQVRLEDAVGDRVEIALRNVQRNVAIPEGTFEVGESGPP